MTKEKFLTIQTFLEIETRKNKNILIISCKVYIYLASRKHFGDSSSQMSSSQNDVRLQGVFFDNTAMSYWKSPKKISFLTSTFLFQFHHLKLGKIKIVM